MEVFPTFLRVGPEKSNFHLNQNIRGADSARVTTIGDFVIPFNYCKSFDQLDLKFISQLNKMSCHFKFRNCVGIVASQDRKNTSPTTQNFIFSCQINGTEAFANYFNLQLDQFIHFNVRNRLEVQ